MEYAGHHYPSDGVGGADGGEKGGLHSRLLTVWITLHAVGGRWRKSLDRTVFAETGWRASAQQASIKNLRLSISLFGSPESLLAKPPAAGKTGYVWV